MTATAVCAGARMNIYVGNFPFRFSDEDLAALFRHHGEVESASIVNDRDTGRSRGFGFVVMSNDDEAREAIEQLDGSDASGRPLTVNEARPRAERPRGGGSSRDGGGGRDRDRRY
jgi:RNA recognition motif-containing protein